MNHHHHGLHRHLNRREFIRGAAGGAVLLAAGSLPRLPLAWGGGNDPKPINGGALSPFRFYFNRYKEGGPPAIFEQSSITDFDGVFASNDVTGWGKDNIGNELYFKCDMRAMQGKYIGVDGAEHQGSFGFI